MIVLLGQPQVSPGFARDRRLPLAELLVPAVSLLGQALLPDLLLQLPELVPQLGSSLPQVGLSLPMLPIAAAKVPEIPEEPEDHGAHEHHATRQGDVSAVVGGDRQFAGIAIVGPPLACRG
jgi:hypothetical protein